MACHTSARSVSVVIPCHNVEDTLRAAIASAQSQSGIDLEILCINDGSDDSTAQLLSSLSSEGVIRYIDLGTSAGAPMARNIGWKLARGEVIQFLDADDVLLTGKIQRQLNILYASGADFIAGAYEFQTLAGELHIHQPNKDCWAGLIASKLGRTSSNMFRATALQAVGGWEKGQKSSQEYELMYRMLKAGARVGFDEIAGARIHARYGSISNTDTAANMMRFIELRRRMIRYLEHMNMLTDYRKQWFDLFCLHSSETWDSDNKDRVSPE